MVIDKIENYRLYANLSEKIAKAFAYINENDLTQTESGKYEIDNDDIFAIVQEYDTKEKNECKLEGHNKFIDIQYIIDGVELIGVTSLTNQIPIFKNEKDDYAFYESDSSIIKIETGMFAIFFPDDLHMPGIQFNQISKVKKVVIKVRV